MTAALLAVRIQVADFYGLAAVFLPLNLHIGVVHIDLLSQRALHPEPVFWAIGCKRWLCAALMILFSF
jgi:hypothetical protein